MRTWNIHKEVFLRSGVGAPSVIAPPVIAADVGFFMAGMFSALGTYAGMGHTPKKI
jgi:hypothetical protein